MTYLGKRILVLMTLELAWFPIETLGRPEGLICVCVDGGEFIFVMLKNPVLLGAMALRDLFSLKDWLRIKPLANADTAPKAMAPMR